MGKTGSDRQDYKIISNLQIIRTWAAVDRDYGGISPKLCDDIVKRLDECLELLKEQETTFIKEPDRINHWHCEKCGYTAGIVCKMHKYCPECGRKVKWDD